MIALLAVLLASGSTGELHISIASPQTRVLLGEPLKVAVTWTVTRQALSVNVEDEMFSRQSLRLEVDGPGGHYGYREIGKDLAERISVPIRLSPGSPVVRTLVFYDGEYTQDRRRELLFPSPGVYALRAAYVGGSKPVVSNTISVTAQAPENPSDREVFALIVRDRQVLMMAGHASPNAPGYSDNPYRLTLEQHSTSPYLRCARLQRLGEHLRPLSEVYDARTREPVYSAARGDRREFQAKHYRELAQESLGDDTWGPFEEEALHMAYLFAQRAGAAELKAEARERLFTRHPGSPSAEEVRKADR
jgi:hypothetical protein